MTHIVKPFWKSWTIWFNLAMALVDTANQLNGVIQVPAWVLVAAAVVGNILLRFRTDTPVTIKK